MPTPKRSEAKDGTVTWRVRYRDEAQRNRSTTFHRQRDAQWFADQIKARGVAFALRSLADLERDSGVSTAPTLDKVAEEFWPWKADYVRSARTVPDYQRQYADVIQPRFGKTPVDRITPDLVAEWVDDLVTGRIRSQRTTRALSPKSIAGRHALLHSILEYAANPRRGYVTANPCAGVTLPKRLKPAPKGLMPAEWAALDAALAQVDERAAQLARFMLATGWRWGEASALPVAAVEDYGASVWVTMMQVNRRGAQSKFTITEDEAKSQRSVRRVRLDTQAAAMVRILCHGRAPADLVFTFDGEHGWTYQRFEKRFSRAASVANLTRRPTIHWLRHTHVAWLAMSGAALPQLQNRVGHESITTTINTYGSMIGDVGDDVLDKFAQIRSSGLVAVDHRLER